MKRGFKAHAKRFAIELRKEIELGESDPLDPWGLAKKYGVRVYGLDDLDCPEALRHFTETSPGTFSGALIPVGSGSVIVESTGHSLVRRRSTMSHELAHVTLEHSFSASLVDQKGCRAADPEQEAEAAELSGELLIPTEAAKKFARRGVTDEEIAEHFGVSVTFARWRLNCTGARMIASRQAAAYNRKIGR